MEGVDKGCRLMVMKVDLDQASREELIALIQELVRRQQELEAQVRELEAETERLRKTGSESSATWVKANRPKRERTPRRKRVQGYARPRDGVTRRMHHAMEQCPQCQVRLSGGRVVKRRQIIELPVRPVEHVEHVVVERQCPACQQWWVPEVEFSRLVVGQQRIGISVQAQVTVWREEYRLPYRMIQRYLAERGLHLSVGQIVNLVQGSAERGRTEYEQLGQQIRAAPVVNGDETGWREDGQNGYLWSFSTPQIQYFLYRRTRSGTVVTEVVGEEFAGTVVSDFYGGYNRHRGPHQRCWVHLLRDIHQLKKSYPDDDAVQTWATAVHTIYMEAKQWSGPDPRQSPWRQRQTRDRQAHFYKQQLWKLCRPYLKTNQPMRVLCQRIERHLPELFVFVADPRVPSDNNAAERSLRHCVVTRKISGGTRSETGSETKSILASLFGTWRLQHLNPYDQCRRILSS